MITDLITWLQVESLPEAEARQPHSSTQRELHSKQQQWARQAVQKRKEERKEDETEEEEKSEEREEEEKCVGEKRKEGRTETERE